jgi:hypothetical protein
MGSQCNTGPSQDTEILDNDIEAQREWWREWAKEVKEEVEE